MITAVKKKENINTFGVINRIKHFFLIGLSALRQYHLSSGFINHNIAQKEVFYFVSINICCYLWIKYTTFLTQFWIKNLPFLFDCINLMQVLGF